MLGRFHYRDPIISGTWEVWQDWLWWVWSYRGGWREWIPAGKMLTLCMFGGDTIEDKQRHVALLMHRLHFYYGLPEIMGMGQMVSEHMEYTANEKSDVHYWNYINTILT